MKVAPYGSWRSPITSELIVSSTIALGGLAVDGQDLYWLEGRPLERGRQVLVKRSADGAISDVSPPPSNVRTRVHEYGGGSYVVSDGAAYFADFADQRLYRIRPGGKPEPFTKGEGMRYADGVIDARRGLMYCVREDHTRSDQDAENTIVAIDLQSGDETVVVCGSDFYSTPRLSPDGSRLCWLSWNHPNMPWDGTEMWASRLDENGVPQSPEVIAGGQDESIFQPEWSPGGELYFVSDQTGWWNLYRWSNGRPHVVVEREAEFGAPQWTFDSRTYAFLTDGRVLCSVTESGRSSLALIDPEAGVMEPIDLPLTGFGAPRVSGSTAYFIGSSATLPAAIYSLDLETRALEPIKWTSDLRIDAGYLSPPEPLEFPTESGLTAHAIYYAPKNRDFWAHEGEKPPLIVMSHGGPTAATSGGLSLQKQYWTSRGFAVLDVNYGGSTGYGRAYRERLYDAWGIVDVDDCVNGALYLAEQGLVDPERMAITGGSAGGYTTLCALTFRDVFKAGASHFGVGDLEALARDTHKFESRYLDRLVGPHPERRDLYIERSPVHNVELLSCPAIFLQGLEDKIVPPNQAEDMVNALREKGVPVAYLAFEGEQHGFRRAENIRRALDAELYFYGRIFGFEPADDIEPVEIHNL